MPLLGLHPRAKVGQVDFAGENPTPVQNGLPRIFNRHRSPAQQLYHSALVKWLPAFLDGRVMWTPRFLNHHLLSAEASACMEKEVQT